ITLFADEWRTPLGLLPAARALHALGRSDFTGTIHLGGPERMSRLEMGQRLARFLGVADTPLVAGQRDSAPGAEPRPQDVSLDSTLWRSRVPQIRVADFESAVAVLAARGNLTQAERFYRTALELQPNFGDAHLNLGNLLRRTRRIDEALAHYRAALTWPTSQAIAQRNLWQLLFESGRNAEALAELNAFIQ